MLPGTYAFPPQASGPPLPSACKPSRASRSFNLRPPGLETASTAPCRRIRLDDEHIARSSRDSGARPSEHRRRGRLVIAASPVWPSRRIDAPRRAWVPLRSFNPTSRIDRPGRDASMLPARRGCRTTTGADSEACPRCAPKSAPRHQEQETLWTASARGRASSHVDADDGAISTIRVSLATRQAGSNRCT